MNSEFKQITNIKNTLHNSQFSDYKILQFIRNKVSLKEDDLFLNTEFLSDYLLNKDKYSKLYVPEEFKKLKLIEKDLSRILHSCKIIDYNTQINYKFSRMKIFESLNFKTILHLLVESSYYSLNSFPKEELLDKINKNELIYDVSFQSIPIHINFDLFEEDDRKLLIDILTNLSVYQKHVDIGQEKINKEVEAILKKYYNETTYYVLDPTTQLYISFSI